MKNLDPCRYMKNRDITGRDMNMNLTRGRYNTLMGLDRYDIEQESILRKNMMTSRLLDLESPTTQNKFQHRNVLTLGVKIYHLLEEKSRRYLPWNLGLYLLTRGIEIFHLPEDKLRRYLLWHRGIHKAKTKL